jgi:hypothetical protein
MTKKLSRRARSTFKTLDELFAAVREACAAEWEQDFEYRPSDEEIASWYQWALPETDEWWSRHRKPHAIELDARHIHTAIGNAILRLDALAEEARRARDRRMSLIGEEGGHPSRAVLDRVDARLTERERALVYCKIVTDLSAWVNTARHEEELRLKKVFEETGLRFKPTFDHQPWIDVGDPSVRLLVALEVLTISRWSAIPDAEAVQGGMDAQGVQGGIPERWKPLVQLARSDRQAALMSLLAGTRPPSTKRSSTVASVIIAETKTMRLAVRRAVKHVSEAFIALHGEVVRDRGGEPLFARSEETSRLRTRPVTHELAMYQAVALAKMNDVMSSMGQYIRDELGPDVYAVFEKAMAAADAARKAQIERLRDQGPASFDIDEGGDVSVIDDSGEVKQRP